MQLPEVTYLLLSAALGILATRVVTHFVRDPTAADPIADPTAADPTADAFVEPMLRHDPTRRYVLFPIVHERLWSLYKQAEASLWHTAEVDLSKDGDDWASLSGEEKHFLSRVLAFFAASDLIVNDNLACRFSNEVQYAEGKAFYYLQMFCETIHSETYSLLLETYVTDLAERDRLFHAIDTVPSIQDKANWALRWIERGTYPERLLAFAIVEGLMFSSSFCAIFYFKKRGILPGLCFANELIMRDEALHTRFACELYSMLERPLDSDAVQTMIREAVTLEQQFVRDCLPVAILGMNEGLMCEYVEYVADVLLGMIKHPPLFNTPNPFEFMEMQSLSGRTNFFERRVGEYQRAGVLHSEGTKGFAIDAKF